MSTLTSPSKTSPSVIPNSCPENALPLSDMVEYTEGVQIPPVRWVTPLELNQPRRDTRCFGEPTRLVKRISDLVIATTLLILLSPLMLLTAIMVKLTSRGPIIFSQTRVGLNLRSHNDRRQSHESPPEGFDRRGKIDRRGEHTYGKHFTLYKFRTMRTDAEKHGAQFATKKDPRVTPIGRFLRKTRIDELPQLINVIRGEMSLVGPRPERPEFIEKLTDEVPNYLNRLGLKPGLTGIAQIENGYDNDIEGFKRKVAYDLLYLQNCCLINDLKILFRTIRVVLTGSGAL